MDMLPAAIKESRSAVEHMKRMTDAIAETPARNPTYAANITDMITTLASKVLSEEYFIACKDYFDNVINADRVFSLLRGSAVRLKKLVHITDNYYQNFQENNKLKREYIVTLHRSITDELMLLDLDRHNGFSEPTRVKLQAFMQQVMTPPQITDDILIERFCRPLFVILSNAPERDRLLQPLLQVRTLMDHLRQIENSARLFRELLLQQQKEYQKSTQVLITIHDRLKPFYYKK